MQSVSKLILREFNSTLVWFYYLNNLRAPPAHMVERVPVNARVINMLQRQLEAVLSELMMAAELLTRPNSSQTAAANPNPRLQVREFLPSSTGGRRGFDPMHVPQIKNFLDNHPSEAVSVRRRYSKLTRKILERKEAVSVPRSYTILTRKILERERIGGHVPQNSDTSEAQLLLDLKRITDERITDEARGAFRAKLLELEEAHIQITAILKAYAKNTFLPCS